MLKLAAAALGLLVAAAVGSAARDGEADEINCGDGNDRVEADASDSVDGTCETVEQT